MAGSGRADAGGIRPGAVPQADAVIASDRGRPGWAVGAVVANILAQLAALGANGGGLGMLAAAGDFAAALVAVLAIPPARGFWRRHRAFAAAIGLALAWALLPLALARIVDWPALAPVRPVATPQRWLAGWLGVAGLAAMAFAGLVIGERRGAGRAAVAAFALAGSAWAAVSIALHLAAPDAAWGYGKGMQAGRLSGTLLNPNAAGCVLSMFGLLAVALYLETLRAAAARHWIGVRPIVPAAAWLGIVACAVAATLTVSRLAVALLSAGTLLLFLAALPGLRRAGRLAAPIAVATVLAPAGALAAVLGDRVASRLAGAGLDFGLRLGAIRHLYAVSMRSPLFGYGFGSFEAVNVANLDADTAATMWNFGAAHCAPIQVALVSGWPAAAFAAAAILSLAAAAWRGRPADLPQRALYLAVAAALACSTIDIALSVPAVAACAAALAGIAGGRIRPAARDARPRRPPRAG